MVYSGQSDRSKWRMTGGTKGMTKRKPPCGHMWPRWRLGVLPSILSTFARMCRNLSSAGAGPSPGMMTPLSTSGSMFQICPAEPSGKLLHSYRKPPFTVRCFSKLQSFSCKRLWISHCYLWLLEGYNDKVLSELQQTQWQLRAPLKHCWKNIGPHDWGFLHWGYHFQ